MLELAFGCFVRSPVGAEHRADVLGEDFLSYLPGCPSCLAAGGFAPS